MLLLPGRGGGLSAKRILFISKKKFHNSQKVNAFPYFKFFL